MGSIPKSLGKYAIVGPIGKGGMGEVFKAFQPDLNRHVAIKTLLAGEQASEDFLQRFQREARLAAKLVHPNIVQIHDIGTEGKLHYIVMEYVEGRSLKEIMAEKRLDPESALKIAHFIARALKFAHDRKIIHRDIKPANVLLDKQGRVRILDFGLAKSLADGKALTMSSVMIGTPCYMSPEQAFAAPEEVDARTDLYSLGAVLHEMLTGRPPFEGATVLAILRKIEEDDPPPVGVSPAVDALVQKALSKDPERRFQSAAEMAEAIKACLSAGTAEAVAAPTSRLAADPPPLRIRRRPRIKPLWVAAGASGAALGGLILWAALHQPAESRAAAAPPPREVLASAPPDPAAELVSLLERRSDVTPQELAKHAEDPQLRRIIAHHFQRRGQYSRAFEYLKGYERAICDLASARSLQRFASPALFRLSIPRPRDLKGPEAFLIEALARHLEGKTEAARLKLKNAEYAKALPEHALLIRAYIDLWEIWPDPAGKKSKPVLAALRRDLDRHGELFLYPIRAIAAHLDGDDGAAREFADRLKRAAPQASESFLLSAILFQRAGLIDLAIDEIESAQKMDPKNVDLSIYEIYLRWLEVLNDPEHEKLDADPDNRKMNLREMGEALDERLKNEHYPAALFLRAVSRALESRWEEAEDDLRKLERRAPLERISVDHERLGAFVYAGHARSRLLDAACALQLHLGRPDAALSIAEQITGDDLVEEERRDLLRENHRRISRLAAADEARSLRHLEEALKLGASAQELKEDDRLGDLRQKPSFLELVKRYEN